MGYLISRDDGWRMPDWLWVRIEPLLPAPAFHPLGCRDPRSRIATRWRRSCWCCARGAVERVGRVGDLLVEFGASAVSGMACGRGGARDMPAGAVEYDEVVGIDWSWLAADGAMTKAPLGGPKTGPNPTDRAKKGRSDRSSARGRASRSVRPRGRQPQRSPPPEGHARLDPDRAPQANTRAAPGPLPDGPTTTPKSAT